jgi:hypothetical protein
MKLVVRNEAECNEKSWFSIFFLWLQSVKSVHEDEQRKQIFNHGTKKSSDLTLLLKI